MLIVNNVIDALLGMIYTITCAASTVFLFLEVDSKMALVATTNRQVTTGFG